MKFTIKSPTKAFLSDYDSLELEILKKELSYINTSNAYQLKRHYNNKWLRSKNKEAWEIQLNQLKSQVRFTLVFEEDGQLYVRPGSLPHIRLATPENITNEIKYPPYKKMPWAKPLPFELYPYQQESVDRLMEIKHGNVNLCTGSGKSATVLKLIRETGLKSVIVTPSRSIFREMFALAERHFGKGKIGAFGDGKKKLDKKITVCIGDSLANIVPGSKEWEFFNDVKVLCVDESHTFGAETLEEVCHGVLGNIPYRYFFSGTQTRTDGGIPLLQSIIGQTVHTLSTEEAVSSGYLCPHDFLIIETTSSNPYGIARDPLEERRVHFLNNRNIAAIIAKIANNKCAKGEQMLVLVEELNQIKLLTKLLNVPYAYAHSETSKARLEEIGLEKVNITEVVERFNKNEFKVLIGTSAIATGTNIYPQTLCAAWIGTSSEIKTKQAAVGRNVRKASANPWANLCGPKEKCTIIDFDVTDNYISSKHLEERIEFYKESGSEIKRVKLNNL